MTRRTIDTLTLQYFTIKVPLQNEWRVGLAVSRIVHMDGVARVGGKLAESPLAAAHALSQAAAGARSPQGEGSVVSMAHHQRV